MYMYAYAYNLFTKTVDKDVIYKTWSIIVGSKIHGDLITTI